MMKYWLIAAAMIVVANAQAKIYQADEWPLCDAALNWAAGIQEEKISEDGVVNLGSDNFDYETRCNVIVHLSNSQMRTDGKSQGRVSIQVRTGGGAEGDNVISHDKTFNGTYIRNKSKATGNNFEFNLGRLGHIKTTATFVDPLFNGKLAILIQMPRQGLVVFQEGSGGTPESGSEN